MKKQFIKPPTTFQQQIDSCVRRGLVIEDAEFALSCLKSVGYYRLTGYFLPFQAGGDDIDRHHFNEGVTFEQVWETYVFDRKLRILVLDAIEHIEVYLRAELSNQIALNHGAHWYLNDSLFQPEFDHSGLVGDIKTQIAHTCEEEKKEKKRSLFINHYYDEYYTPETPPSWMVFQAVSLGVTSKVYDGLFKSETSHIFEPLRINNEVFSSWIHAISYVRNLCAHHSRLWNKSLTIKPKIARKHRAKFNGNKKVYSVLVVMQLMLSEKSIDNQFSQNLRALVAEHPEIPLDYMGFPENWLTREPWVEP